MKTTIKFLCLFLFAGVGISLLSGCNTVQGFGKDMQAGGQQIQKAANESR